MDNKDKIALLAEEMEQIKTRLIYLENEVDRLQREQSPWSPGAMDKQAAGQRGETGYRSSKGERYKEEAGFRNLKEPLFREGLEMVIGKNLLNRIGIIILIFAVGYFLKYSFDNGWIGELGRVAIGFVAGIALLVSGDILMRRGYQYFSQGFSGGGIAVIYLSTYAAVNFYHLISSVTAFVLLVLTAAAGGLLSNRQNALGVAVISTLGGFMGPFLIGSEAQTPATLLSYIAILNLAVLYLAYFRNWRALNMLAFLGTVLVYFLNRDAFPVSSAEQNFIWIHQSFLLIYFVIFGALSFLYNVRTRKPAGFTDIAILTMNAAFFFGASYDNLYRQYSDWMGLLAIILSALYVAVALGLKRKKMGDQLLFLSMLGTGLVFLTIALPLQFDERWVAAAWIMEAITLVYTGFRTGNKLVLAGGLGLLVLVAPSAVVSAPYYSEPPAPLFNAHSLTAYLGITGFILAACLAHKGAEAIKALRLASWVGAVMALILALAHISWEVENALSYFHLTYSLNFSISLSWVVLAVGLILWGMVRNLEMVRLISLALFGIVTVKIMFNDLAYMPMVFRIIILTVVGFILVAVSFAYQKKDKKDASI